jgi:predicted Holliday junction resolvase-like endonuclease
MFTLLKIIILFILVIAILLGATLFRVYRDIRETMHKFGFNDTRHRRTTHRRDASREESIKTQYSGQMKKKKIPKDEGEYVDFTEV